MTGSSSPAPDFSLLADSSGLASPIDKFMYIARSETSASARNLSNYRADRFAAVHQAISTMARYPEGHPFHIAADVAARASDVLGVLRSSMDIAAPKIFSQDDETLVMKWVDGIIERYLSLSADDLSVLERNVDTKLRCVYEVADEGQIDMVQLFESMAAKISNRSVEAQ